MDKGGGEEGEEEMYGESNIEIYNTMCKTDSQWEFAVWLRELNRALQQAERWGREADGREVLEHALFQGIFPTQGSNLGLPHCR